MPLCQPGDAYQQGHLERLLISAGFSKEAVIADQIAVVAGENYNGVIAQTVLIQCRQDVTHCAIYLGDHTQVLGAQHPATSLRPDIFVIQYRLSEPLFSHQLLDQRRVRRWPLAKGGAYGYLIRCIQVVEGGIVGPVGLDEADVEDEGTLPVLTQKASGMAGLEGGLGQLLRQLGRPGARKDLGPVPLVIRFEALFQQKVMVVCEERAVLLFGEVTAILVIHTQPVLKAVLGDDFVAQMPLAVIAADIIRRHQFSYGWDLGPERDVVGRAAVAVRVQAGHDRRAGRRADRLRDVGVLKEHTLASQPVQDRRLNHAVAITAQGVSSLLVGEDKQQIGFPTHLVWLSFWPWAGYRSGSCASSAVRICQRLMRSVRSRMRSR